MDKFGWDFVIPTITEVYFIPLRYCALECDVSKGFATLESFLSNTRNTLWDSDGGQVEAQLESPSTDTRDAIGNSDGGQRKQTTQSPLFLRE